MDNIFTTMGLGNFAAVAVLDDDCCIDFDPRYRDANAAHMVCWHRNYKLGDEMPSESPSEWRERLACSLDDSLEERLERMADAIYNDIPYRGHRLHARSVREEIDKVLDRECVFLSVSMLDHSGLTLYEGRGSHWSDPGGWDSGQIGWMYMTRADILREFGGERLTRGKREQALRLMRAELSDYASYVSGDIYSMLVYEKTPEMFCDEFAEDLAELNLNTVDSCCGFLGGDAVEAEMRTTLERLHAHRTKEDVGKIEAGVLPGLTPWFRETLPLAPFGDEIVEGGLEDICDAILQRVVDKVLRKPTAGEDQGSPSK